MYVYCWSLSQPFLLVLESRNRPVCCVNLFRIPLWIVLAQTEFLGTMAEEGKFHQDG